MLRLYDKAGNTLADIREYRSIISTRRFREHSEWRGVFAPKFHPLLEEAYFVRVGAEPEIYLAEFNALTTGKRAQVESMGRSASSLLGTRTLVGTKNWNTKAGAMIADMFTSLTGARAIPLAMGTGADLGTAMQLQRSWGDCGSIALEVLAAKGLGMQTRINGGVVYLDVVGAFDNGVLLGEKFNDGSTARVVTDKKGWANYAYVAGEGEGAARVVVEVNLAGTSERRELFVDARDLRQDALPLADYQAQLAARGLTKLADTKLLEYAEASDVTAPLEPGEIAYFDTLTWSASFMATEVVTTYEGGTIKRSVGLGDPPDDGTRFLRKVRT